MNTNDVHAPEKVRCPSCGARNAPDAQWCGQCLQRFSAPEPPPPPPPPLDLVETPGNQPAAPLLAPVVKPGIEAGGFRSTEEGLFWRCTSCETENPLAAPACTVCGTTFAAAMRPAPEKVERDPGTTAMISLFFPGAGHAYLGLWPQAVARGVISVWVALMAVFFAVGGRGASAAVGALYGLVAFGLWLVAAHDAFREANNEPGQVLLVGRRFTFLVLGLLVLLLASLFFTALTSR